MSEHGSGDDRLARRLVVLARLEQTRAVRRASSAQLQTWFAAARSRVAARRDASEAERSELRAPADLAPLLPRRLGEPQDLDA